MEMSRQRSCRDVLLIWLVKLQERVKRVDAFVRDRHITQLHDPKRIRFAAKLPAQCGDAVQIARSAYGRVLVLESLESFRVKNGGCEYAHHLETAW